MIYKPLVKHKGRMKTFSRCRKYEIFCLPYALSQEAPGKCAPPKQKSKPKKRTQDLGNWGSQRGEKKPR